MVLLFTYIMKNFFCILSFLFIRSLETKVKTWHKFTNVLKKKKLIPWKCPSSMRSPKSLNADNIVRGYGRNWDWDPNFWEKFTDFVTWVQYKWLTSVPLFSHRSEHSNASWSHYLVVELSVKCSVHEEITPTWRTLNHCQMVLWLYFPNDALVRRSLKITNYIYPEESIYWLMGTLVFPKEKKIWGS